jgi:hypothetical protein
MTSASYTFPDEATVLDACDKLVDFHAWDAAKIDAHGWLSNFDAADRPYAVVLLSRFTFFADHLVDQLFRSAYQNLSNVIATRWEPFGTIQAKWRRFCDTAIITLVQGERPNPSDSGWLFARKARQALGIPEERLLEPAKAIRLIAAGFQGRWSSSMIL